MARRAWLVALLVLGGLAVPAFGQVKLEWKFKEGDKFFVESTIAQKGTVTIQKDKSEQDVVSTTVSSFTVQKPAGGNFVLEQKIEDVTVKTGSGAVAGSLATLAQKLKGATFKITLSPDGQITQFEGYNDALKKVFGDNENALKFIRSTITEESLREAAGEVFVPLPKSAVSRGQTWSRTKKLLLGPLGSFEARNTYRYGGKDKEGDLITVTSELTYTPPAKAEAGLPFKITGGRIQSDRATGTIIFDAAAGRLVRSERNVHFKGPLTLEMGQAKNTMQTDLSQKVTVRLSDKRP
jgi:hypothetical protein